MKEEQFFEAFGNIDNRFIENPRPASGKRWVRGILWKIILVIVVLSLVSILCLYVLYNSNPYYTIEKIDGEYFMVGKQPWVYSKDFGSHYWPTYHFDSPAEMKRKLLECDFTEQELEGLYHVLRIEPGRLELLDLDHLSQPVLPDHITWDGTVSWSTHSFGYTFELTGTAYPNISFSTVSKTNYETRKQRFENESVDTWKDLIKIEHVEDRNATVFYYRHNYSNTESMEIRYVLQSGGREYLVEETYYEKYQYTSIYLREGDCYGQISVRFARPSVEWITSFGLTPVK